MNPASQLGKMAAGVPKKYSEAEIAKRTKRLKAAQKNRAESQRVLRRSNAEVSAAHPAADVEKHENRERGERSLH